MSKQTPDTLNKIPDTIVPPKNEAKPVLPKQENLAQLPVESILLKTSDGKMVALTSTQLDRWFAAVENRKVNADSEAIMTSQLLGYYGLRDSRAVIQFLRTPAGQSVLAMIEAELANLAAIEEQEFNEMREADFEKYYALARFFLALVGMEEAQAASRNEFMQRQIDKILRHAKEAAESLSPAEIADRLEHQFRVLGESAHYLQASLDAKYLEIEELNQKIVAHHQHGEAIDKRYNILEKGLTDMVHFLETSVHLKPIHAVMADKVTELESTLTQQAVDIGKLLAENKVDEAKLLMHHHNGLHLQVAELKDRLAVHKKEKVLYDEHGDETSSHREAAFILTPDLKIVKADGKYYLLKATQNLSDLTDNQKAQALKSFDDLHPKISCVKNAVKHNCKLEKQSHHEQGHLLEMRGQSRQAEIRLIRNQLHHIKAAQAAITNELKKNAPDLRKTSGVEHSIPKLSRGPAPSPSNTLLIQQQHALSMQLLALQRNPSRLEINRFRTNMTNVFGNVDIGLNRIIPGRPISEALMRSLNQSIYRLKLPTDAPKLSPEKPSTAPTPFNTKPKPY